MDINTNKRATHNVVTMEIYKSIWELCDLMVCGSFLWLKDNLKFCGRHMLMTDVQLVHEYKESQILNSESYPTLYISNDSVLI